MTSQGHDSVYAPQRLGLIEQSQPQGGELAAEIKESICVLTLDYAPDEVNIDPVMLARLYRRLPNASTSLLGSDAVSVPVDVQALLARFQAEELDGAENTSELGTDGTADTRLALANGTSSGYESEMTEEESAEEGLSSGI